VVFGIQQFVYSGVVLGLTLVPRWIPGHSFWAYFMGAILIVCGACIALQKMARLACSVLGALFFACALLLHAPEAIAILHDVVERTRAFENLAICGGAFVLAGIVHGAGASARWDNPTHKEGELGRIFFALAMVVFGIDHILVPGFMATFVPAWAPAHLFFVYFTGAALIAAGLSIATKIQMRLAASLLGFMFLLWVALLHAPRVASDPHNGNQWNSLFVAVAMAGCALVIAGSAGKQRQAK
jgi:uncharacterized membrane protein YphA (DoxX/SURF4 family)